MIENPLLYNARGLLAHYRSKAELLEADKATQQATIDGQVAELARLKEDAKSSERAYTKLLGQFNLIEASHARLKGMNNRQYGVIQRLKEAIQDARQAMSNQTHGGAQYQPDILEADSILAQALGTQANEEKEG